MIFLVWFKLKEALLESVVDKKPADFAEIFEDIMVEKMRSAVDDYSVFVAENLFVNEEEELEQAVDRLTKGK